MSEMEYKHCMLVLFMKIKLFLQTELKETIFHEKFPAVRKLQLFFIPNRKLVSGT